MKKTTKFKFFFQKARGSMLSFAFTVLVSTFALAQVTVTGKVIDDTGEGLPGVNILELGSVSNGTITDIDGMYEVSVPANSTLQFSYTGYTTQEIGVGSGGTIDVTLANDAQLIDEVVVTGYQIQRKRDISGAVSVINTDDIQSVVASSFAQKLQGRAAGVTVSNSGTPGGATNVRIRGISSFGNNDPLYIIDGVPVQDKGNVNINPNDIETMQVLKDASTASIYGSRASNGVIVITTKQGKAGKTKVTYNGSVSMADAVKGWDDILITDGLEYLDMTRQFHLNAGAELPAFATTAGSLPKYIFPVGDNVDESTYHRYDNPIMRTSDGTNWWEEMTRTGIVHNHNLTLTGGSDNAKFAVSGGFLNQEGVLQYNTFRRANLRVNSSFNVGKRIRIGENFNFARRSSVNNPQQSEQGTISQVYKISPLAPVYDIGTSVDADGNPDSFGGGKSANLGNASNPVAALYRGRDNKGYNSNIFGNVYGEVDIIDGLVFRSAYNLDMNQNNSTNFSYRTPENQENQGAQNFRENWGVGQTWTWTNTLAYNNTFSDKHTLGLLAGYEAIKGQFRSINGSLNNYFTTDPNAWYVNNAFGDPASRGVGSNGSENSLLSTFGKLDYGFDDKYIISATVRRDGSSRFGEEFRYGVFPAFSFAWRLSNESFLQDIEAISDLKLRASWGVTGNQNIRDYNYTDIYAGGVGSTFYAVGGGNSPQTGYAQTSIGNPDTKWEEAESLNFGLDAAFLDNKLTFVFDIYERKTNDLLYNAALPGTAGLASVPFRNVAGMVNRGFDFALGYRDVISSDLSYNVDLNFSRYVNEVTKIDGVTDFFYPNSQQGRIDNRFPIEININQLGAPISSFRGYTVDGIYNSQAEVDALPINGAAATVGGLRFKDLNSDGVIDDDDIGIIGSPHPDFTAGLNMGVTYKNFDVSAFVFGSYGNEIFNYVKLFTHFRQFFSNVDREYYLNNGTGDVPKLNVNDTGSRQASSYFVEDGSYLRLSQLQVGYTLPSNIGSSAGISNLKVFVQGQNLLTLTNYSGLDPALSNANIGSGNNLNDIWTGYDIGQYPSNRLITFGVNADF